jgi:hypothetical protein
VVIYAFLPRVFTECLHEGLETGHEREYYALPSRRLNGLLYGLLYFSDRVPGHGSRTDLSVDNFRVMSRKNSACGARQTLDRDTRVLYIFDYVMVYS